MAYRSKARTRANRIVLNPLGLVVRAGIAYLVATSWDYADVRHYVARGPRSRGSPELELKARFDAEPAKRPAGFRLADHVREDRRFSYPLSAGRLELKALFDADSAVHLTESRLSANHRATEQPDGRMLIEATVPDTADLRWWLLGFGAGVEVLGPAGLRAEFADQARRLGTIYG